MGNAFAWILQIVKKNRIWILLLATLFSLASFIHSKFYADDFYKAVVTVEHDFNFKIKNEYGKFKALSNDFYKYYEKLKNEDFITYSSAQLQIDAADVKYLRKNLKYQLVPKTYNKSVSIELATNLQHTDTLLLQHLLHFKRYLNYEFTYHHLMETLESLEETQEKIKYNTQLLLMKIENQKNIQQNIKSKTSNYSENKLGEIYTQNLYEVEALKIKSEFIREKENKVRAILYNTLDNTMALTYQKIKSNALSLEKLDEILFPFAQHAFKVEQSKVRVFQNKKFIVHKVLISFILGAFVAICFFAFKNYLKKAK